LSSRRSALSNGFSFGIQQPQQSKTKVRARETSVKVVLPFCVKSRLLFSKGRPAGELRILRKSPPTHHRREGGLYARTSLLAEKESR